MAIIEGLKFAEQLGHDRIELESDCLHAINLINRDDEVRNEIGTLIEGIKRRSTAFSVITFSYVSRSGNVVADAIAKWAKREKKEEVWNFFFPEWICTLVSFNRFSVAPVA